jgi:DNA-directed RNA polymerase specialized sigma subunit
MLRLVFVHGLSQREVMRMWGWSESKVSRKLSSAMAHIEEQTLEKLKQMDPWLDLTWQDFVDLCDTHQVGFL